MSELPIDAAKAVAEALFAGIEWTGNGEGYMPCPGQRFHSTANGAKDCRITLAGGKPPTIFCFHSRCAGAVADANHTLRSALGRAAVQAGWKPARDYKPEEPRPRKPDPAEFQLMKLRAFAGDYAAIVDLCWLADRSAFEPSLVTPEHFLAQLYRPGEKVVVFTEQRSQGQAVWPDDPLPRRGPEGVWYLVQPVDGHYRENPRAKDKEGQPKLSRRSEESVTAWRYLVLESDEAPARLWLGALVRLPLRIAGANASASGAENASRIAANASPVM